MDQTVLSNKPTKTMFKENAQIEENDEDIEELIQHKSPEYKTNYKILRNFAPCNFKLAELVDQLDEVEEYETLLKSSGLILLRTKFLETQPLHKKLLARILAFNKAFEHHVEIYSKLEVLNIKQKEQ